MPTVAACYCALHHISPDRFAEHCLARVLYPHARFARPLAVAMYPDFFDADLALLRAVGDLRSPRGFAACCAEYRLQLAHQSFARRHFLVRVSLRRVYHLVVRLTTAAQADTPERAYPPAAGPSRRARQQSPLATS